MFEIRRAFGLGLELEYKMYSVVGGIGVQATAGIRFYLLV